jgi:D-aminopeptidase
VDDRKDVEAMTDMLDRAVAALPGRYVGPGGAVAVVRNGEVLVRHAWGWADAARRLAFTPATPFLVCSITKQFTCGLLLDRCPDPEAIAPYLRSRLPDLEGPMPSALHLAHNQSGLRDYWALAMLCGAAAEGTFDGADASRLIARARTLQFAPGTRYSYCNQNFRLLGDAVVEREGRPLGELLRRHVLDRAGMPTAQLAADTAAVPGGTVGYEGTAAEGFRPAVNRIHWTGDAGLAASLDDMIAWEKHIDATREDAASLYQRQSAPVAFADGSEAFYGFGLARMTLLGRKATGHGGGLRGWRSFRCYLPGDRVSVVVLFNHMADPRPAALEVLAAALGETVPAPMPAPAPAWAGRYIDPETGIAARIEPTDDGRLRLTYTSGPELLAARPDGSFAGGGVELHPAAAGPRMVRTVDHIDTVLRPATGEAPRDVAGRYRCRELDAGLTLVESGGLLYGACDGDLGQGEMVPLVPYAADTWLLPCPRALDFSPPGDWTLRVERDGGGVSGLTVGCWLARGLRYARAG